MLTLFFGVQELALVDRLFRVGYLATALCRPRFSRSFAFRSGKARGMSAPADTACRGRVRSDAQNRVNGSVGGQTKKRKQRKTINYGKKSC